QDMQDDYDQAERNEYGELSERIFFFCSRRSLPNILSKWPCSNQILLELSAFQEIKQLIGAAFTLMCLLTGSLWGRPMWGTYWVWDARLTGRMQIAWPSATTRCIQSSLSVRKRGPHHDLSTGEVLPSDPRCFIPQADEGARATAPTRPDHFPAPSFPTTDRWCYKHRSVPAFVRLLTAASVTLSRDIRHTPISLVFLLRGLTCCPSAADIRPHRSNRKLAPAHDRIDNPSCNQSTLSLTGCQHRTTTSPSRRPTTYCRHGDPCCPSS